MRIKPFFSFSIMLGTFIVLAAVPLVVTGVAVAGAALMTHDYVIRKRPVI